MVEDLPTQPSLRRLRQFEIKPSRELGQNFLIDSNILDVIGRAAELKHNDVILEVGGGLGVLSEYLAPRVRHVHVVELDKRLERALLDAVEPFSNVTLHFADAVKLDLGALDPAPNKVVANLPYGVAATVILQTIEDLPEVTRWVAMVQREVGQRFAASVGSAAYGVPSVLAQLCCEVKVLRPISRSVFYPMPNVDSVLLSLVRERPAPPTDLRDLVRAGFSHRRKALAGSISLAELRDQPKVSRQHMAVSDQPQDVTSQQMAIPKITDKKGIEMRVDPKTPVTHKPSGKEMRDRVRIALVEIGLPADARAETLTPRKWEELYAKLAQS